MGLGIYPFRLFPSFLGFKFSKYIINILCVSLESVTTSIFTSPVSPVHFLILVFLSFPLVSLPQDLSIAFVFPNNLLFLCDLVYFSFNIHFNNFCSILKNCILVSNTLGLFLFKTLGYLRSFWIFNVHTYNYKLFSLNFLICITKFLVIMLSFSFDAKISLVFLTDFSMNHYSLKSKWLSPHAIVLFLCFFLFLISALFLF